jgi:RNA polymerase sigma-70 factor (ECF subfamily)
MDTTASSARPAPSEREARFHEEALPHLDALFGAAMRYTRDPRDAEDLVQDTVLAAYRFYDRFEAGSNCKAWLFKILTNTFINKYRRRVREREVREQLVEEEAPSLISEESRAASRDPERFLQAGLLSDDVRRALDAVPSDYRMAVVLCDLEEFSYKEIAEIMDCPVGTVMSRLHRGRRLLQRALYAYAVQEGIVRNDDEAPLDNVVAFPGVPKSVPKKDGGGR